MNKIIGLIIYTAGISSIMISIVQVTSSPLKLTMSFCCSIIGYLIAFRGEE